MIEHYAAHIDWYALWIDAETRLFLHHRKWSWGCAESPILH